MDKIILNTTQEGPLGDAGDICVCFSKSPFHTDEKNQKTNNKIYPAYKII